MSSRYNATGSNATTLHRAITAVKFISGNVNYTRDNVDFVQMLHYKSIDLDRILDEAVLPQSAFEESREAEIVVTYGKQDQNAPADGIVRSILHRQFCSRLCLPVVALDAETPSSNVELAAAVQGGIANRVYPEH